jgi:hypothetical protein
VQDSYHNDPFAHEWITKLSLDASAVPNYTLNNGLLRYKKKLLIGHDPTLHHQLITALHCFAIGGHSGIPVTYRRVKQTFTWKGLKQSITDFVKSCQVCIQSKPDRSSYPGKL